MSEELKQRREIVKEFIWDSRAKHPEARNHLIAAIPCDLFDRISDLINDFAEKFASQVCEQREKEIASVTGATTAEQFVPDYLEWKEVGRENMHIWQQEVINCASAYARVNARATQKELEQVRLQLRIEGECHLRTQKEAGETIRPLRQRAEAAELALQTLKDTPYMECSTCSYKVNRGDWEAAKRTNHGKIRCPGCGGYPGKWQETEVAKLKAALQAKEQEVTKLFKEVSLLNGQLAQAEARELALQQYQQRAKELKLQLGLTEEAHHSDVVAKISKLAQARQQAIADPGIREIAALSLERALLWHKAGLDSWSESDWFTAFAGEVGELGNVIKKLNRYRDGLPGNSRSEAELRSDAAKEIADCYLYMDLLAQRMSIDLLPAIIAKFNEVSERNNFPQRIRSLTPPPALTVAKEAK